MNKTTSEAIMKLKAAVEKDHGVTEFGIIFNDTRWTVGFIVGHKSFVGSGDTPQAAYVAALHDLAGTEAPPF